MPYNVNKNLSSVTFCQLKLIEKGRQKFVDRKPPLQPTNPKKD